MTVICGLQALWASPVRVRQGAMCARMPWQRSDYYFKAEVRRGLLGKREWSGHATQKACIITTRWEGFDSFLHRDRFMKLCLGTKIKNIQMCENKNNKNNCQTCIHNRVKCRRHNPRCFHNKNLLNARGAIGLFLQPELFHPYLSFNKSNHSDSQLRPTFSGSQLQDTFLKSPWRPVGLWCEQRCRVTHLKWAAIGWRSLEGVELQYG